VKWQRGLKGAAAFIIVSRRHRDAPKMAEGTAAPGVSGRVTQDTPDKREPDEMDKDLDDLLN